MSNAAPRRDPPGHGRPPSGGRLRRYGWLGLIAIPVVGGILGVLIYGQATEWYFMYPGIPTLERFTREPGVMAPLAEALNVPPPPNPADLEPDQVARFLEYYGLLRRNPRDTATLTGLGRLFEQVGHPERAEACFRRAKKLEKDADERYER